MWIFYLLALIICYVAIGLWTLKVFVKKGFGVIHYTYHSDDIFGAGIAAAFWFVGWAIYWGKPAAEWIIRNPPSTWAKHEGQVVADNEPEVLPPAWLPDIDPGLILPPLPPRDAK